MADDLKDIQEVSELGQSRFLNYDLDYDMGNHMGVEAYNCWVYVPEDIFDAKESQVDTYTSENLY